MLIRSAKRSDVDTILELVVLLRKSAYEEMNLPVPDSLQDEHSKDYLLSLFDDPWIHLLVAEKDDSVVGFCLAIEMPKITEGRNRMDVIELVVDHEHRGGGIGAAFMKRVEEIAYENGLFVVKVATGTQMKSNAFYQKLGYKHFENYYRKRIEY